MKKISNYKKILAVVNICFGILAVVFINGCIEGKKLAAKSGVELWAENCQRCHNTPSPITFSDDNWKTIGMHMQTRALITDQERDKIVQFLQSTNH